MKFLGPFYTRLSHNFEQEGGNDMLSSDNKTSKHTKQDYFLLSTYVIRTLIVHTGSSVGLEGTVLLVGASEHNQSFIPFQYHFFYKSNISIGLLKIKIYFSTVDYLDGNHNNWKLPEMFRHNSDWSLKHPVWSLTYQVWTQNSPYWSRNRVGKNPCFV